MGHEERGKRGGGERVPKKQQDWAKPEKNRCSEKRGLKVKGTRKKKNARRKGLGGGG